MKAVIALLLCLVSAAIGQTVYARAVIRPIGTSGVTGYALFSQPAGGNVTVQIVVQNITINPDSLHGIHIHQFGDLTDMAAGLSTGGHWNPTGAAHGCPENGTLRHYGDMGNWNVTGGSVNQNKTLDLLQLSGINSIVGRAVVVHANVDDCVTANTGDAGSRLAFGVIGIINSTTLGGSGEANNSAGALTVANCYLQPSSGSNVSGWVWLFQNGTGSTVMAQIMGINNTHGFHLHWFGDIRAPDGLATGGHFNPANNRHGVPPYVPRHLGDMGVIYFTDANGVSYYHYTNDQISLNGLNNVVGRAIHVHLNGDNCVNPIGDGGARIAQCVIGISGNNTMPAFPATVPTTQPGEYVCGLIYNNTATASSGSMSSTSRSMSSGSSMTTATASSPSSDVAKIVANFSLMLAALLVLFY